MSYTKIDNVNQLKHLAGTHGPVEVFIQLNFGARSYKWVSYDDSTSTWSVDNNIDGTHQEFTDDKELWDSSRTHIGEAIDKGALWTE